MADATDLKSVDRKVVWVRLPPSAPFLISLFQTFALHFKFGCVNSIRSWVKDDAKMTLLLTRSSFEFDNLASWFGKFVTALS